MYSEAWVDGLMEACIKFAANQRMRTWRIYLALNSRQNLFSILNFPNHLTKCSHEPFYIRCWKEVATLWERHIMTHTHSELHYNHVYFNARVLAMSMAKALQMTHYMFVWHVESLLAARNQARLKELSAGWPTSEKNKWQNVQPINIKIISYMHMVKCMLRWIRQLEMLKLRPSPSSSLSERQDACKSREHMFQEHDVE